MFSTSHPKERAPAGLTFCGQPEADVLLSSKLQAKEFSLSEEEETVHIGGCLNGVIKSVDK